MKRMHMGARAIAGAVLALAAVSAYAGSITVGSKAPDLKVAKWNKGKPVKAFEKGKVYVVEFWATWCGPCKVSIPHLTDMATKEFKDKVTFIGVSVWERAKGETGDAYMGKVQKFVDEMGAKMNYNVAVDGTDNWMAENWMSAAGQNGIPAAFIVDQTGTIAWIGHPMDKMDEALRLIVAGKYDREAAAAQMKKRQELEGLLNSTMGDVFGLQQKGDFKGALEKLDAVMPKVREIDPDTADNLESIRFSLLLHVDSDQAYAWAEKVASGKFAKNANALNQIAWEILDAKDLKNPNYKLAAKIAKQGVDLEPKDGMVLDTYALALFKSGDVKGAIASQTKALQLVKEAGNAPAGLLQEMEGRLAEFKKAG